MVTTRKGVNNKFLLGDIVPMSYGDHKKLKLLESKVSTGSDKAPFPYYAGTYSFVNELVKMLILVILIWIVMFTLVGVTYTSLFLLIVASAVLLIVPPSWVARRENTTGDLVHLFNIGNDIKWLSTGDLNSDVIYRHQVGDYLRRAYDIAWRKDTRVLWQQYDVFSEQFTAMADITLSNQTAEDEHKEEQMKKIFDNFSGYIYYADQEIRERDKKALEQIHQIGVPIASSTVKEPKEDNKVEYDRSRFPGGDKVTTSGATGQKEQKTTRSKVVSPEDAETTVIPKVSSTGSTKVTGTLKKEDKTTTKTDNSNVK